MRGVSSSIRQLDKLGVAGADGCSIVATGRAGDDWGLGVWADWSAGLRSSCDIATGTGAGLVAAGACWNSTGVGSGTCMVVEVGAGLVSSAGA